jgi:hypothetical protein
MTAEFAIPATTFVLRALIQERVDLAYQGLVAPTVSTAPPPRPAATNANDGGQQAEPAGIHLFLHHIAPNPAWRNMYEPHVDTSGNRSGPAPLAIDLQYLLAVMGTDLEREVLLGLGVTALGRFGIVPRSKIAAILGAITVPATPTRILDTLTAEPLDDPSKQPELITVAQGPVDLDVSTRIWSALQSPLRPSAYFLVTTVFLDVDETIPDHAETQEVSLGVRPDVSGGPSDETDTAHIAGASP